MNSLTHELIEYLSSGLPRQVLIVVKDTLRNLPYRLDGSPHPDRKAFYRDSLAHADQNRSSLIDALQEESRRDQRIKFNSLGAFNQVALTAPREVIERIATRGDVVEIIPDEPTDVLDECED